MTQEPTLGTFEPRGDDIDVRFERHYPRPAETVWSALTEPERLADWMGMSFVEPFVGGRFEMMIDGPHPARGHVLAWEPPRLLEFTWSNTHAPNSVIRCELRPTAEGTLLIFTHTGMPYENSALMLPGWHDFLDRLGLHLVGAKPERPPSFRPMQSTYIEHYSLKGVRLEP